MASAHTPNPPPDNIRCDSGTSATSSELLEIFKAKAGDAKGHLLKTAVFEWDEKCSSGVKETLETVEELKSRPEADIRVM